MSLDDADRLPFPPLDSHREERTPKPDTGRATATNALASASEEVAKLGRQLTAVHNAVRLALAQTGRVIAVTTKPVGPPDPEEDKYDESEVIPVDRFHGFAASLATLFGRFDCDLSEMIVDGAETFAAAKKGEWEQ